MCVLVGDSEDGGQLWQAECGEVSQALQGLPHLAQLGECVPAYTAALYTTLNIATVKQSSVLYCITFCVSSLMSVCLCHVGARCCRWLRSICDSTRFPKESEFVVTRGMSSLESLLRGTCI